LGVFTIHYIPWVISLCSWPFLRFAGVSHRGHLVLVDHPLFTYAYYRFSPRGGNIQGKIQAMLLSHLDWDGEGKAVDIGCGNAPLSIMLSQKYLPPGDWHRLLGRDVDYSKRVCESNAQIEGWRSGRLSKSQRLQITI